MSIEARRHAPRVLLNETAYVNLGSGNRGIILDVSEGGLRFKTAAPVDRSESIRFQLASTRGIDGIAEVAWTDESRTTGGLRFTTVPPEIRQQIRNWIEGAASDDPKRQAAIAALQREERDLDSLLIESSLAATDTQAEQSAVGDVNASAQTGESGASENHKVGTGVSYSTLFPHANERSTEKIRAGDLFEKPRPMLVGEDEDSSTYAGETISAGGTLFSAPAPKRHPVAVTVLVLLVLLGATTVAAEYYYPNQARAWMSGAQAKVAKFFNMDHKQPVAEVEPASMAGASRFEGSFEPGKPGENAAVVPATPPAPPAPPQTKADVPPGADHHSDATVVSGGSVAAPKSNAETEYELAQTYLAKGSSPDQQAKAVELLWLATEKGDVDAEMQLADLYATGQAVQKSCVQARILLKAAAASNPSAARPKLKALDQSGCN